MVSRCMDLATNHQAMAQARRYRVQYTQGLYRTHVAAAGRLSTPEIVDRTRENTPGDRDAVTGMHGRYHDNRRYRDRLKRRKRRRVELIVPEEAASFLQDLAKVLREGRPVSDVKAAVLRADAEEIAARMSDSARDRLNRFVSVLDGAGYDMLSRIDRAIARLESDRDFLALKRAPDRPSPSRSRASTVQTPAPETSQFEKLSTARP